MQKIVPHLWFDKEAKEAAAFYVKAFGSIPSPQAAGDSTVTHTSTLKNTPSGDCDIVSFTLKGFEFMAISAGPYFRFNPSISFMLNFDPSTDKDARKNLDALWEKLSDGGEALMPLQEYPFSKRYGWIKDKYGVTWQLILTNPEGEPRPFLIPSLMFTGENTGKAGEAMDYWISLFKDAPSTSSGLSKRGMTAAYPPGAAPEKDAKIMFADFMLEGQWFAAMDSGRMHTFSFNEAISLLIRCGSQEEIDQYWKLSAVKEAEQCGWCKDKYGVSWQVHANVLEDAMNGGDEATINRVTQAFMPMKKFDIAALKKAAKGK